MAYEQNYTDEATFCMRTFEIALYVRLRKCMLINRVNENDWIILRRMQEAAELGSIR